MLRGRLLVIASIALVATAAQAGEIKVHQWPTNFVPMEVTTYPVVMDIGFWMEITNQFEIIKLEQISIHKYQGCVDVKVKTNFNLLLRPASADDFQIATQINFRPESNYQFAGLIIYESDANFIQAGREYCKSFDCAGAGLYMDYYKKGVVVKPDFGQTYKEANPILLRLSRRSDSYTFEASTDGKVWFTIGSHTSDMKPIQIGLVTGQRVKGDMLPAAFDYFEVRSLP